MTDDAGDTPTQEEFSLEAAERAVDAGMSCLTRFDLDGALAEFAAVEGACRFSTDPGKRSQWARALNGIGFIDLMDAKSERGDADVPDDRTKRIVRWGLKQALARFDQALAVQGDPQLRGYAEGNKAYTLALLGREEEARNLFRRLFETGGRAAYDRQVGDLKRNPVPEDSQVRRLLDAVWAEAERAVGDQGSGGAA